MRGLIVVIMFWASAASAQPMPALPRDAPVVPPQMPAGTAVIKGRVVDAQTGSALARARVRLNWMGPGGSSRPPIVTDQSGAFAFSGLPAGSFSLMSDKSTYLNSRFPEGGETVRSGNRSLSLSAGQTADDVVIRMYHGGAIAGRVVDAYGDPVEFAQVQTLKLPKFGRGKPQQRGSTSTNDLGEFRVARLDPGKYLLMVMARREQVFDQYNMPVAAGVDRQPLPTYYPAALSIDDAQPIAVDRGTTASNVEIALVEGVAATVSGVVVDAAGQPFTRGGSVGVRPIMKDVNSGFGGSGGPLKPDGTFTFRLTPGEYQLDARTNPGVSGGPPTPGSEPFGSVRINVSGDMTGITIQLGPGARATGRFVFDGSAAPPQPPSSPNGPPIFSSPDGVACRTGRTQLSADWTFTVDGLFGACQARFMGGYPGGWSFKAILYEGKDLTDQTADFVSGQRLKDVVVLFTDKRTELELHVVDERGAPTREFVALAFPTDKAKWTDPTLGYGSRYIRTYVPAPERVDAAASVSRPGATAERPGGTRSKESMVGLPAGEYFVVAVDDLESEAARDPDTFEQLSGAAARVTIKDGEPADLNLRRVRIMPRR